MNQAAPKDSPNKTTYKLNLAKIRSIPHTFNPQRQLTTLFYHQQAPMRRRTQHWCPLCHSRFNSPKYLILHWRFAHTGSPLSSTATSREGSEADLEEAKEKHVAEEEAIRMSSRKEQKEDVVEKMMFRIGCEFFDSSERREREGWGVGVLMLLGF